MNRLRKASFSLVRSRRKASVPIPDRLNRGFNRRPVCCYLAVAALSIMISCSSGDSGDVNESRNRSEDSPRVNRLAGSSSAYLKSAAHQPVNWYPWDQEAFQAAKELDRPILLDIGAVWCHWCHVMDRETYENEEIAEIINEYFIPVKVDMDERPDVDRRYQRAVRAITGGGGWPLTAFLTPEGKLFFGGTYFPPSDRLGRPGMRSLLPNIAQMYKDDRDQVLQGADRIYRHLETLGDLQIKTGELSESLVDSLAFALQQAFDDEYGGFGQGNGPKFPNSGAMELAMLEYFKNQDDQMLEIALKTLKVMAKGGIRDHIGGGFHRYSVDRKWNVPHFEKMSYVNAGLLKNYLHAYQISGDEYFKQIAEGIVEYVDRVLSDRENGGFYGHQDADVSLEDDGDYFTWTQKEIENALSDNERKASILHYGVREIPHDLESAPERNVLYEALPLEEVASKLAVSLAEADRLIESGKERLLEIRNKRKPPFVDKNIFSNYNGMMISAYLEASRVLGRDDIRDFALRSLSFVLEKSYTPPKGVRHIYLDGKARVEGLLEDQVWMAYALLDAFEVTGDFQHLEIAMDLMDYSHREFWDGENGGFWDSNPSQEALGLLKMKRKAFEDSPYPAANSIAAMVLDRIYYLTDEEKYRYWAQKTLEAFAGAVAAYGAFASSYALGVDYHLNHPAQAVVVGKKDDGRTLELMRAGHKTYRPGKIVINYDPFEVKDKKFPETVALIVKYADIESGPQAYICAGTACAPPTDEPKRVSKLLRTFGMI